ncbi:hypothetical protein ABBQ38_006781 [Trebouxia sp. C0009 RCD-2024]
MPNPLRTFTSSTSGVHLPPTLEFNPPQWFDPPHRDQVYWLENVARAVSHSTRVSWQVITSKFPMSPPFLASHSQSFDSPTSPPFPGYDAWHTMSSWHSTTSAEDLHLDPVVTSLHMPKSSALPTSPASTKNTKVTSINDNNDSKFDNATAVALWTPQGSPHSVSTCPRELPTAVALWRPGRVFTGIGSLLTVPSLSTTVAVWRQEQAFNDSGTLPKIALPSTSVALWRQERACPYIGTCLALASPTTTMAVWRSEQAFTGIGSLLAAWIPKQAPTDLDPFLTDALLCTAVTVWRSEQALTVMGTCPAYDMPTDVQFVNSTATLGDPAGLSPSIERLPFSTGGSTAVNIVLRQHPAHSIYFVNAIESASAGFISIGVQRNSALGLEFAAKTNTQQHVVRYKLGPNIPQKNVNRRDNSAHTTPRFISASGTSRISSSYSLPGNVSVTKPGLLSNISAEGLSFGIQATWQAGKLLLKRSCPSFRQLALLAVLLWVLTSLRDKRTAPHPYSRLSSPMRPMSAMDWHIALHEHGIAGVKAKHLQYQTKTRHLAGNRTETHHVKADCKRPVSITCTAHPTDSNTHREAPQMRQRLHTESEAMAPPSTVADSQDVAVQTISAQVLPYKIVALDACGRAASAKKNKMAQSVYHKLQRMKQRCKKLCCMCSSPAAAS